MHFFEHKWPAVLLWPFSLIYGCATLIRHVLYIKGFLKIDKVGCRVISVGNITVGGTGKTPIVMFLAKRASDQGKKVCIVSRGYGRKSRGTVVVSDERNVLVSSSQAGDEPYLMASSSPGIPVIVDRDRVRGARYAVQNYKPDLIFLDDGFQHRRLFRDKDIVALGFPNPIGNGWLLPAGPLREYPRFLQRADILWINSIENSPRLQQLLQKLSHIPVVFSSFQPVELVDVEGRDHGIDLDGKKITAFCGVGNPNRFRNTLEKMGAQIQEFIVFRDHFRYSKRAIRTIEHRAVHSEFIITTEKDWVKLPVQFFETKKWYCVRVNISLCGAIRAELF
jgi:tetraacyldisaccharide 4'-kinase